MVKSERETRFGPYPSYYSIPIWQDFEDSSLMLNECDVWDVFVGHATQVAISVIQMIIKMYITFANFPLQLYSSYKRFCNVKRAPGSAGNIADLCKTYVEGAFLRTQFFLFAFLRVPVPYSLVYSRFDFSQLVRPSTNTQ